MKKQCNLNYAIVILSLVWAGQGWANEMSLSNAYAAYQAGQFEQAQQIYGVLYQQDNRNLDVLQGLANLALQRGDTHAAANYLARLLALAPQQTSSQSQAYALLAMLNPQAQDESRIKTLLREQHNVAVLHFALGNLYAQQQRWHEAQQAYFNAYTLSPNHPAYVMNLAVSLDHLKQSKPALQYYQRVLQLESPLLGGNTQRELALRIQQLQEVRP